jgi:HK97 family phage major capsid protein
MGDQTKTPEKELAELLAKMTGLFQGDDSLEKIVGRIKQLEAQVEAFKGVDIKKTLDEVDRIRAKQESIVDQIRRNRSGVYVPGLEDQEFSLVRALTGIKRGRDDWSNVGAAHEKEILDACRTKAAQSIGSDSLGGYFVPDQVIPEVIAAIYTQSVFVALDGEGSTLVSVLTGLSGGNVKVPKFNGGTLAYWIGEEDSYIESMASVGDITLNPKKLGVLVKLTDAMQRLGGFGFEALLRRDMAKAAAAKLDYTILAGRGGDNAPRGIINNEGVRLYSAETGTLVANTVAGIAAHSGGSWDGGELTFDGLDDMALALEEDNVTADATSRVVAAPRFFRRLARAKILNFSGQTSGQPYLAGSPILTDAALAGIIGAFSKMNQIPTNSKPGELVGAANSGVQKYTTVVRGNLGEILLGRWGGLEIEDDGGRGKGFTSDHTFIKLRMYADVQVREPRALIFSPDVKVRD